MQDTFSDLPDALVRDLLEAALPVAEKIRGHFDNLGNVRDKYRQDAIAHGLVRRKADLDVPREPSVVGIDGSYQLHRLTSLDLCAAAAVAVEGTSKEAKRHWPEPFHRAWVGDVPHAESTTLVLRGLMVSMELELANLAPHDLVMLDGSFGSLIIYLNQSLSNVDNSPAEIGDTMKDSWKSQGIFGWLMNIIGSDRAMGIPKYTSRKELSNSLGIDPKEGIDGKTLATLILEPGEYTSPLSVYEEDYHLPVSYRSEQEDADMNNALQAVRVVYYRPFGWAPAMRLELPGAVANSLTRLSIALEGVMRQFFSPAVVEPYPLFLADRMVKSLGAGVNVVEQTVSQQVLDRGLDTELRMLLLQNYRTEDGRGGV